MEKNHLKKNTNLTQSQAIQLAKWVKLLEKEYIELFNKKMGLCEWALDGYGNKIYIIQTRPETSNEIKELFKKI